MTDARTSVELPLEAVVLAYRVVTGARLVEVVAVDNTKEVVLLLDVSLVEVFELDVTLYTLVEFVVDVEPTVTASEVLIEVEVVLVVEVDDVVSFE